MIINSLLRRIYIGSLFILSVSVLMLIQPKSAEAAVGQIRSSANTCIASTGTPNNLSTVYMRACDPSLINPEQNWVWNSTTGRLMHSSSGFCLASHGTNPGVSQLWLAACTHDWTIWDKVPGNERIFKHRSSGNCLNNDLTTSPCGASSPLWNAPADYFGKIVIASTGLCLGTDFSPLSCELATSFDGYDFQSGMMLFLADSNFCMKFLLLQTFGTSTTCNELRSDFKFLPETGQILAMGYPGRCLATDTRRTELRDCNASDIEQIYQTTLTPQVIFNVVNNQCLYADRTLQPNIGFEACDDRAMRQKFVQNKNGMLQLFRTNDCLRTYWAKHPISIMTCALDAKYQMWEATNGRLKTKDMNWCLDATESVWGQPEAKGVPTVDFCDTSFSSQKFRLAQLRKTKQRVVGVWGVNPYLSVFSLDFDTWVYMPGAGSMTMVSRAAGSVWGIRDGTRELFTCSAPCMPGDTWVRDPSGGFALHLNISTSGRVLYVAGTDGRVYYKDVNSTGSYSSMAGPPGGAYRITAGFKYIFALSNNPAYGGKQVFRCVQPCAGTWTLIDGGLMNIDLRHGKLWGTNDWGNVYARSTDTLTRPWSYIPTPAPMRMVTAGVTTVTGVGMDDKVYQCAQPCLPFTAWDLIPGLLRYVDGD